MKKAQEIASRAEEEERLAMLEEEARQAKLAAAREVGFPHKNETKLIELWRRELMLKV